MAEKPLRPDPIAGLSNGDSVVLAAMQLAVWMGAGRIVLYGVDHTFRMPRDFQSHDQPVTDGGEENHFLTNYRSPGEKWWPPRLENIDRAFQAASDYFRRHGIEVANCTRGGKLEAFPRRDFDAELTH